MNKENRLDKQLAEELSEDVLHLRSVLSSVVDESPSKVLKQKKAGRMLRLIPPALLVAASLILAIAYLPGLLNHSEENLYTSYYETYPMALSQRGDAEAGLNSAIASYIAGDFPNAADNFMAVWKEQKDEVYLLYAASAKQAAENYEDAIKIYDQIISTSNQKVTEQAQWYKALALIKVDRISDAKSLLTSLSSSHYKNSEIKELISSL